jgi:hypothetical protein
MNRADCKAIRSAALVLLSWAKALEGTGLNDEQDKHMRLVKRLRQIANAEQKLLPVRLATRRPK